MHEFIDLHNHSLFGVDDGATTLEMSKNMLEIAYQDGIKAICFTPHFKPNHFSSNNSIEAYNKRILYAFEIICAYAKEKYPDMRLILGNEIMFHNDMCDSLALGNCRTIGKSKYVLVEFKPETSEYEMKSIIYKLLRRGFKPIIAHIERYSAFLHDLELIQEFKSMGAILQINAYSIVKFRFGKIAKLIKFAFKNDLVDIVCTDAHNDSVALPNLSKAFTRIANKFGFECASRIFYKNPQKILINI